MEQAILVAPRRFEMQRVADPQLGPNDVEVRVLASGICASELHAYQDAHGVPLMLGHEVAGEVIAIGPQVSGFRPGDRVTGLFNKGFAERAVTTADRVLPLPKGVEPVHAFGEPMACAMSAALRTKVELGDRVAFVGLGFMGLLMLQLLRLKGPSEIVGIDLRDDALVAGRKFGADVVTKPTSVDARDRAPNLGDKGGFDVVVEATGTQGGLDLATELVRQHGVLSILGYHQGGPRSVNMQLWNFKAIDVLNAHERRSDFRMECMRRGLALASAGRIDLASLVTHTYPLANVGDAFASLETKPRGFIKSVVVA
jgi:threonine dehydrogenase-like Zn-dependent dehydrogenase